MHASLIMEVSTHLMHLNTSIIYQFKALKPELPRRSHDYIFHLKHIVEPKFTSQPCSNILNLS